jgi:hypothetical protein
VPERANLTFFSFQLGSGETVTAVAGPTGQLYLDLSELCLLFGLDAAAQLEHWRRQPLLQSGLLPLERDGRTLWLARYDTVLLWRAHEERPTIRAAVTPLAYQFPAPAANSLDAALAAHLFSDHPWLGDWLPADSPIVEAYRIALAHLTMAREQLLFELLAAQSC